MIRKYEGVKNMSKPKAIMKKKAISITLDNEVLEAVKIIQEYNQTSSISEMINNMLKTTMYFLRAKDKEGTLYEIVYDIFTKPHFKLAGVTKKKFYKTIKLGDTLDEAITNLYQNYEVVEIPR